MFIIFTYHGDLPDMIHEYTIPQRSTSSKLASAYLCVSYLTKQIDDKAILYKSL
jgi:hypothetical protein